MNLYRFKDQEDYSLRLISSSKMEKLMELLKEGNYIVCRTKRSKKSFV